MTMGELYHSDILMALGKAIADSFWQMSLLWLAYQVLVAVPFQRRPSVRHAVASLLTIAGTVWFIIGFSGNILAPGKAINLTTAATAAIDHGFIQRLLLALPYLSMAYLVVLVALVLRFGYQWMMMRSLRVDLLPAHQLQDLVDRLAIHMSIDREIFIHFSRHVSVPSTIGVLKPVILLPLATMNNLSAEQMEAVIIHEMAHIRRFDYLINLVVSICSTLMFFNPFIHLLAASVRRDCELSCDDEVIRFRQDPQQYAHALLLLEKSRSKPSLLIAATGTPGLLLGRVKRILNMPEEKVKYRHKLLALVLLAGSLMGVGHLLNLRTEKPAGGNNREMAQTVIGTKITRFARISVPQPQQPSALKKAKTIQQTPQVVAGNDADRELTVAPPAPDAPPAPPKPGQVEPGEFIFVAEAPTMNAERLPESKEAPDPRDKRPPGILYAKDITMIREMPKIAGEHMPLEDLIRLQRQAEAMKHFRYNEPNTEFFFVPDVSQMAENMLKEEMEKAGANSKSASKTRARIRAMVPSIRNSKDGMTITIINEDEHIEIRVNENGKEERN